MPSGTQPSRPPAINPAAAAAAAAAAQAAGPRLTVPRRWRRIRRTEAIVALAALAGCLVAGIIALLVIANDGAGAARRSRVASTPAPRHETEPRSDGGMRHPAPGAITDLAGIGAELQAQHHRPLEGLDGADPRRQHAVLCAVGDVPIALRLPADQVRLLPDGPPSVLACRPDGDAAWTFVSVTAGRERRCGGAAVERGMLTAWLDAREAATGEGHVEQWRAREALAGAVLAVSVAGQAAHETHVQLGRPLEHGPIHVRRFFCDESLRLDEADGGKPLLRVEAPASPWSVDLRLDGTCGRASASSSSGAGPLEPGAEPALCTLRWEWAGAAGEPFMETALALGPAGPLASRARLDLPLRLTRSRVLEPWDSYRRLADVLHTGQQRLDMAVLPPPRAFAEVVSVRIPRDDGTSIGVLSRFADVVWRYREQVPDAHKALHAALKELGAEESLPLSMWKQRLAEQLRKTPGFRAWRESADGRRGLAAGESDTAAYWSHLKSDLAAHRNEPTEVGLGCLLEELDAVPGGKRLAESLLENIGAGDATFSGDLGVTFAGIGRSVLVSFGRHGSHTTPAAAAVVP